MNKVALITGVTGQDGSYLVEFLLKKNYIVHGIKRRSSSFNTDRINHIFQEKAENSTFQLHYGDLSDSLNLVRIINNVKPDNPVEKIIDGNVNRWFVYGCGKNNKPPYLLTNIMNKVVRRSGNYAKDTTEEVTNECNNEIFTEKLPNDAGVREQQYDCKNCQKKNKTK